MNRFLPWFNLAGVCALAILCAIQWHANRRLHLRGMDLEAVVAQQSQGLADKDKTIQGNIADMNEFRDRLARSDAALAQAQAAIQAGDARLAQVTAQRDGLQAAGEALKTSLGQWQAAVAARDEALKKAEAQALKLAADRNDAVIQFNELAARYNAAQDQLKQAADQLKKIAADRNELVVKFNDLAGKYNALVQQPATSP